MPLPSPAPEAGFDSRGRSFGGKGLAFPGSGAGGTLFVSGLGGGGAGGTCAGAGGGRFAAGD
jgi:hypothetical protein